jgi:biopolymer transport protein TolR
MGMAVGGKEGGVVNEPNVVPMIDVLLVLLIIFMAAVPTMRKAIDIQLPDPTPQTATANTESNQIVLEVLPGGQYSINTEKVDLAGLGPRLTEIYSPRPEKIIFVKGDPGVKYQDVIQAMDIARGSGVKVIGVPPKPADTKAGATGGR